MPRSLAATLTTAIPPAHLAILQSLAALASSRQVSLYIVGGFVRDLMLGQPNLDFDLVLEGDATIFAAQVVAELGGQIVTHAKFRTATWTPPQMPDTEIDLVSARRETYARPAALPDVTLSTIVDDIHRRDFTLNTLAIRLDGDHFGELLDLLNGEQDLKDGLIRVLHPASFIEDPTRLFRAVRYEQRYAFQIAPDTLALIPAALPIVAFVSGDRLRHELELILTEKESNRCVQRLAQLGILQAIHASLVPPANDAPLTTFAELLARVEAKDTVAIIERLNLSHADILLVEQTRDARNLITSLSPQRPSLSNLHGQAKNIPDQGLKLALKLEAPTSDVLDLINTYLARRAALHLQTTGQTISALGLPPGPKYKEILFRLQCAYLDGAIQSATEEQTMLEKLVAELR